MKRVLSVQDISCIGKCSLTVALPVISAAGIETAILPTAVLSTHTAFKDFTFRDLTDDLQKIMEHWKKEKISFDGIYTGYLGSARQIEIVEKLFSDFRQPGQLRFVDPAMGDNGKLYCGFSPDFAKRMGVLCGMADIIVPNLTEASFMLGMDFPGPSCTEKQIRELLKRLCGLGCPKAVLTGVSFVPGHCGVAMYDSSKDDYFTYFSELIPKTFHGTGDLFASACFAALINGQSLQDSLRSAVEFTVESIRLTMLHQENANWYGVDFETAIPMFLRMLGKAD